MRKLALNDEILLKIEKPARHILASRFFMTCSTAVRMCGVSVSILRG